MSNSSKTDASEDGIEPSPESVRRMFPLFSMYLTRRFGERFGPSPFDLLGRRMRWS